MTFRTRLLLIFTVAMVGSVGLVELLVLANTRTAFERMETQRVDALVAQFRKEFDRRRQEIVRAVQRIADSEAAVNIAISSDYSQYYGEAAALASAQRARPAGTGGGRRHHHLVGGVAGALRIQRGLAHRRRRLAAARARFCAAKNCRTA